MAYHMCKTNHNPVLNPHCLHELYNIRKRASNLLRNMKRTGVSWNNEWMCLRCSRFSTFYPFIIPVWFRCVAISLLGSILICTVSRNRVPEKKNRFTHNENNITTRKFLMPEKENKAQCSLFIAYIFISLLLFDMFWVHNARCSGVFWNKILQRDSQRRFSWFMHCRYLCILIFFLEFVFRTCSHNCVCTGVMYTIKPHPMNRKYSHCF